MNQQSHAAGDMVERQENARTPSTEIRQQIDNTPSAGSQANRGIVDNFVDRSATQIGTCRAHTYPARAEDTLTALLVAHAGELRKYLSQRNLRKLCYVVSVENLMKEVWIAAYKSRWSFRFAGPGEFSHWLTAIAQRRLIDHVRTAAALRGVDHAALRAGRDSDKSHSDLFNRLVDPGDTPSRVLSRREAADAVRATVAGLRDGYRRVIVLRYC